MASPTRGQVKSMIDDMERMIMERMSRMIGEAETRIGQQVQQAVPPGIEHVGPAVEARFKIMEEGIQKIDEDLKASIAAAAQRIENITGSTLKKNIDRADEVLVILDTKLKLYESEIT